MSLTPLVQSLDWTWQQWWPHLEALTPSQLHQDVGGSFSTIYALVEHMVGAETFWYSQLNNTFNKPFREVGYTPTLHDLKNAYQIMADSRIITLKSADPKRVIQVEFSATDIFKVTVEGILVHMITHAHFHRGQLVEKYRRLNLEPPNIFYIDYFKL